MRVCGRAICALLSAVQTRRGEKYATRNWFKCRRQSKLLDADAAASQVGPGGETSRFDGGF